MGAALHRLRFARGMALQAIRALVLVLALPFASAGALPLWANLVGFDAPHLCQCARDHHGCVCARCHTDPDAPMLLTSESVKGRCGDDEMAVGGKTLIALAAPGVTAVSAPRVSRVVFHVFEREAESHDRVPPPTPPPRPMV